MLTINSLCFSYDSKQVFKDLTVSFAKGWTALIGANGSGKSTLIRLISGALVPDSGNIHVEGSITLCPQIAEGPPLCFTDPDILNNNDFYALLEKLSIGNDWIERWDTLSGGEKKRCIIADTLIRKPAVLILDEPVNHIDQAATEILLTALKSYSGIGIVVSHNMAFLNDLASSTLMLIANGDKASRFFAFTLAPLEASGVFEKEQEGKREIRSSLSAEVRRISQAKSNAVREAREKKQSAMSKKNIAPHDSDSRAKVNLARLTGKDKTGGKKAAALDSSLSRKLSALDKTEALGLRKTGAGLSGTRSERPVLYFREAGEIDFAFFTLNHPALEIRSDSRIVLSGPNGSGKTSLLKHILATINTQGLEFWYLPQELSSHEASAAFKELEGLSEKEKGAVLSVLYRLGSEPSSLFGSHEISPGETRKLLFALAMLRGVSLIALDEPTNHMDAVSAICLADAIGEYAGAAVIITHDSVFAEKIGKNFWHFHSGQVTTR